MSKVVIIGSGYVGSTIAYTMILQNTMDEVVLIDINTSLVDGEVMDISHGIYLFGNSRIRAGNYSECANAEIIIITAGINRKTGQTRDELMETNQLIMKDILNKIKKFYNNCFILVVSNPVDQLTEYASQLDFIRKNKICGTGCMLDTSRWISELSKYLKIEINRIRAYAVGKHGSSQSLLWEDVKVDNILIDDYCKKNNIEWNDSIKETLHNTVTSMGSDIIFRKGKTQFGISMIVTYIVECLKKECYTTMSVGNVLQSNVCRSSLVRVGNFEVISI